MKPRCKAWPLVVILLLAPAAASAQYLTVFAGANFGGDSGVSLDQSATELSRLNVGARVGTGGAGLFGGEVEFGYTPDFYGKGTIFDSSSVLSLMGNAVITLPAGPVRPYMLAGFGLIRRTLSQTTGAGADDISDARAAYNIGGGVTFYIGGRVGINADLRYFRNFSTGNDVLDLSNDPFNFARGSVGVTVRF